MCVFVCVRVCACSTVLNNTEIVKDDGTVLRLGGGGAYAYAQKLFLKICLEVGVRTRCAFGESVLARHLIRQVSNSMNAFAVEEKF